MQLKGAAAKTDAGVSNLVINNIFQHNKGAMAYLDKGVNNITVTFDNPAELSQPAALILRVAYQWKEYDGTGWTIDKSYEQYVLASPATFTITTGGSKGSSDRVDRHGSDRAADRSDRAERGHRPGGRQSEFHAGCR